MTPHMIAREQPAPDRQRHFDPHFPANSDELARLRAQQRRQGAATAALNVPAWIVNAAHALGRTWGTTNAGEATDTDATPRARAPRRGAFRAGYAPGGVLDVPPDYEARRAPYLGRSL